VSEPGVEDGKACRPQDAPRVFAGDDLLGAVREGLKQVPGAEQLARGPLADVRL